MRRQVSTQDHVLSRVAISSISSKSRKEGTPPCEKWTSLEATELSIRYISWTLFPRDNFVQRKGSIFVIPDFIKSEKRTGIGSMPTDWGIYMSYNFVTLTQSSSSQSLGPVGEAKPPIGRIKKGSSPAPEIGWDAPCNSNGFLGRTSRWVVLRLPDFRKALLESSDSQGIHLRTLPQNLKVKEFVSTFVVTETSSASRFHTHNPHHSKSVVRNYFPEEREYGAKHITIDWKARISVLFWNPLFLSFAILVICYSGIASRPASNHNSIDTKELYALSEKCDASSLGYHDM